jgi:NAD(P)-dependent dehydrogenase (short-subunit alcohol dehydrogenase family)
VKDLFSLAGKTALITGGSVGIGAMIAEGFVNFGARVYLAARREEALKRKRDELAAIGSCEYLVADVSRSPGSRRLFGPTRNAGRRWTSWSTTPASATATPSWRRSPRSGGTR